MTKYTVSIALCALIGACSGSGVSTTARGDMGDDGMAAGTAGDDGGDDGGGDGADDGAVGDFDTIIVDSNNNNNDENVGFVSVSNKWTSSASTPGYHGTGYWYATTEAVSDAAAFWFYLPEAGTHTIEAWWTAGNNRSAAAPFVVMDAGGSVIETVKLNQRAGGNAWNTVGSFDFPAGWNRVMLSRWAAAGSVVIADAIRVK